MPSQTTSRQQDSVQPNVQSVTMRADSLEQLRDRFPALKALADAALNRVLDKSSDLDKLRGQLVEELGGVNLAQLAEMLGPGHEYIRGDRLSIGGKQATDGMIIRPAEAEPGV